MKINSDKTRQEDCISKLRNTVFSRIEAAASICFFYFLVRLLFEGGFYSRAASIYRNSLLVIRQMALFRNFFHESGYNSILKPFQCIRIFVKQREVFWLFFHSCFFVVLWQWQKRGKESVMILNSKTAAYI